MITEEQGIRSPKDGEEKVMVDCALFAIEELMHEHPECLLYGQDVGKRLGGVFREAATLAQKFGITGCLIHQFRKHLSLAVRLECQQSV